MKLYKFVISTARGGNLAVVLASSKEEAKQLAKNFALSDGQASWAWLDGAVCLEGDLEEKRVVAWAEC